MENLFYYFLQSQNIIIIAVECILSQVYYHFHILLTSTDCAVKLKQKCAAEWNKLKSTAPVTNFRLKISNAPNGEILLTLYFYMLTYLNLRPFCHLLSVEVSNVLEVVEDEVLLVPDAAQGARILHDAVVFVHHKLQVPHELFLCLDQFTDSSSAKPREGVTKS